MTKSKIITGEIIGTYILILFGCGSISLAINFQILNSLYQVALFWTAGVTLGIYASKNLSGAHINPCFSISALINKEIYVFHSVNWSYICSNHNIFTLTTQNN